MSYLPRPVIRAFIRIVLGVSILEKFSVWWFQWVKILPTEQVNTPVVTSPYWTQLRPSYDSISVLSQNFVGELVSYMFCYANHITFGFARIWKGGFLKFVVYFFIKVETKEYTNIVSAAIHVVLRNAVYGRVEGVIKKITHI